VVEPIHCRQATEDFEQTVRLKVKSFGQKRKLREALKGIEKQVTTLETKLVNMEALTPSEDALCVPPILECRGIRDPTSTPSLFVE
jgi:hypothetical protein